MSGLAQLAARLHGSAVIAANLASGQTRVPFLGRPEIESRRDHAVRRIVRHAARNVPYYRELFARLGLDPGRFEGAADLERLPLLDRDLVRRQPALFRAEGTEAALSCTTSGSTGTPIVIDHDRGSLLANLAYGEREREPLIRLCGGSFRPREVYVGYETSTFKQVMAFHDQNTLLPVRPRRRFVSLLEPVERVASLLAEERPHVLVGYGGWIDLFFKTVSARGLTLPRLSAVLYMGEALPPGARAHIEQRFGLPVLSRYNAVEAFKIGFSCEAAAGFHLHEDLCHVRVVRGDGGTAAPGEQGAVVISNLVNQATVLLNYPIGDVAALSVESCACGRTLRRLSDVEGRVEDVLPLEGGRFVHPRAVWEVFKDDPGVLQYQVVQHELQRFEVALVTEDEPSFARARSRALPALVRLLAPDAKVAFVRRESLERGPGGKLRVVRSHCAPGLRSAGSDLP